MKLAGTDYNPVTQITTEYWVHEDGRLTVRGVQDVEPVIASNTTELNTHSAKSKSQFLKGGLGTKVASIPMILVEKILREKGLNLITCSDAELRRALNDSDYARLRTAHGRI